MEIPSDEEICSDGAGEDEQGGAVDSDNDFLEASVNDEEGSVASAHPFPLPSVNHKRVPHPSKADQERIHQEELVPAWAPFGASRRLASVTFPDLIGADTLNTHDKKVDAIARDFSRSIESHVNSLLSYGVQLQLEKRRINGEDPLLDPPSSCVGAWRAQGKAYLRIYMQVPCQGTETLPGRLRAQQATLVDLPSNPSDNVEAWRRLTTNNVGVTGHLIAEKREAQGEEDPVPGGWAVYILVSKVPVFPLGDQQSYFINGIFRWEGSQAKRFDETKAFHVEPLGRIPAGPES